MFHFFYFKETGGNKTYGHRHDGHGTLRPAQFGDQCGNESALARAGWTGDTDELRPARQRVEAPESSLGYRRPVLDCGQ